MTNATQTATFYLCNTLSVITNYGVDGFKIGAFEAQASRFNEVTIDGTMKPAKASKYIAKLKALGFTETEAIVTPCGFPGKSADVNHYRVSFSK